MQRSHRSSLFKAGLSSKLVYALVVHIFVEGVCVVQRGSPRSSLVLVAAPTCVGAFIQARLCSSGARARTKVVLDGESGAYK